jgi:hypothetical protein
MSLFYLLNSINKFKHLEKLILIFIFIFIFILILIGFTPYLAYFELQYL